MANTIMNDFWLFVPVLSRLWGRVQDQKGRSYQTKANDGAVRLTGTWQTCNQGAK